MRKQIGKIKSASLAKRMRRKLSIRKTISGTPIRPRLSVTKTNKNLFIQVVDDTADKTLFSVQTFGKNAVKGGATKEGAKEVGTQVAGQLKSNNISEIVFDRSGHKYHGVIEVLANTVREGGIKF
jgi:large subunit ribosomal protein L18